MAAYEGGLFRVAYVDRDATQLTEGERASLRVRYAERERAPLRQAARVVAAYVLPLLPLPLMVGLSALLQSGGGGANVALFTACALVMVALWVGAQRFVACCCPYCDAALERTLGKFCPSCGERTLSLGIKRATCTSCKTTLEWERSALRGRPPHRLFAIRACPVCGLGLE